MLDIKLMREQTACVKAALGRAGVAEAEIDQVLECDAHRRRLQSELDTMRALRKQKSTQFSPVPKNRLLRAAAAAETPAAIEAKRAEMRDLGDRISTGEHELTAIENRFSELMLGIRNIPRDYVPTGSGEADNKVVSTEGEPGKFDFKPLPHWELGEKLGIIDFERGVKLSGTRFYLLRGAGARLERALIAWMLDLKREQGYLEIIPPLMVTTETATSTGHLPKNADTMYHDSEDDFWFIPTAEVPLTSMYRGEILEAEQLPIYVTAYTPCFRREKMSAGRDVRGIKRGHQFDKVEMVKLVRPETSDDELKSLIENAAAVCRGLKIPFRILQLCTADLSFASAATYDLEMWAPGLGEWLEVSSCSNCTDFQMRRANI